MKHLFIIILTMGAPHEAVAQSTDRNYVKETLYLDSTGTAITTVSYYDGTGNHVETATTASGTGGPVYTRTTYDGKGREIRIYRPVPVPDGTLAYIDGNTFGAAAETFYNDPFAYTTYTYDHDDRLVTELTAGRPWHTNGAASRHSYSTNTAADAVLHYGANAIGAQYMPGMLDKETATDADGRQTETFRDLAGRVVLERHDKAETYYRYDRFGQLATIYQPEYQNSGDYEAFTFRYEYDRHGNIIKKTLPGAGSTLYWYDREGRLAFEQDAHLKERGLYRFYLYDAYARLAVVGTCRRCNTDVQNITIKVGLVPEGGILNTGYVGYGVSNIDTDGAYIEKVCYYDSYTFLAKSVYKNRFQSIMPDHVGPANGLLTANIVAASDGQLTFHVYAYDRRGNVTGVGTLGLDGYASLTARTYSLTNKITETTAVATVKYGEPLCAIESNTYSPHNDMLETKTIALKHSGEGTKAMTITYGYDGVNRLASVKRSGKAGSVEYTYDIHGWPISIDTPSFHEQLHYADGFGVPCYNGNISTMTWQNMESDFTRGYHFFYDHMNRLEAAKYGEGNDLNDNCGRFDEYTEYDLNSNITAMDRFGHKQDGTYGAVDMLRVTLDGNRVQSVTDGAEAVVSEGVIDFETPYGEAKYTYDTCGALTSDTGRGIAAIEYDKTGSPRTIQFMDGSMTLYVYDAEGNKLRTIHRTAMPGLRLPPGQIVEIDEDCIQATDTIDYLLGGNLIMKNGRTNWYLFDGGYAETVPAETVLLEKPVPPDTWEENPSQEKWENYRNEMKKWEEDMKNCTRGESFCFYFYNKDHIGNNREVVDTDGNVSQVTNYYPYGMPFCDTTAGKGAAVQPYKYNGKELDLMHGLNTYDYGARQYFPALPMWDRMDKMCESDPGMSPYCYCKGDPVNSYDPDGNDPVTGAIIGAGIEIGSQLIENYDTKQSFLSNLANNVNWVNVGIAAGEGALTSGVSALKSVAAKTAVTAVTATAKEISNQVKDGATSYKDINYKKVAGNAGVDVLITIGAGKYAAFKTNKKFRNTKATPSNNAVRHYRAGQKRYSRSTIRNARKRLQEKKENYYDKMENMANVALNGIYNFFKRI